MAMDITVTCTDENCNTIKFLNFRTPENFAVIYLKFKQKAQTLRPCHTLPDSANGRVTDSNILCPFVSVRMRFLSVPNAVNTFRVR